MKMNVKRNDNQTALNLLARINEALNVLGLHQRVRRAVKKGVSWKEAVRVCKESFGARYAGY